jgi:site-specific recombinase XerD
MKKLVIKRIFHRAKWRYAIIFDFDPELSGIVKEIKEIKEIQYSSTHRCWYLDETEENLRLILHSFNGHAEADISSIALPSSREDKNQSVAAKPDEPGPRTEIEFERNSDSPSEPDSDAESEFESQPEAENEPEHVTVKSSGQRHRFDPVEFRISEHSGRLVIRFTGFYDKSWVNEIKTYGKLYYDRVHKEFLLQWSKMTVDSLSDYFAGLGIPVKIIRPKPDANSKGLRKDFGEKVRSRELTGEGTSAVGLLRSHLEDKRYSVRTIETYITLLELFFKFFHDKSPDEITQNEVSDFMNDFIIKNGFSASYQNQMISAIKLYYELSGKGRIIPQFLERPRRGRALPKVFSKEEVTRILNSARNTKHKLLLWIIYSCGLRRSEVINIRLEDIDRTRNIIHIREGKGRVDRIVPVPDKLWSKLDEYIDSYNPKEYLFEGQHGRRYSSESVYNVFKQALNRVGIKKEVGVHSLRHSYATHLHENGLDIRYIQELLGHKSTLTTEIYTHVSRRNLISVRSPIEDLDLK